MAPAGGHGPLTAGPRALLLDHPLVLCAGKGGVGKSTTAATLALRAADAGHRTLLVSTDPAHNLGDIFGHDASDRAGRMRGVAPGLDLLEIDSDVETERYLARVKDNVRRLVRSPRWRSRPSTHTPISSGSVSSRSVCPVGAVSMTTRS